MSLIIGILPVANTKRHDIWKSVIRIHCISVEMQGVLHEMNSNVKINKNSSHLILCAAVTSVFFVHFKEGKSIRQRQISDPARRKYVWRQGTHIKSFSFCKK